MAIDHEELSRIRKRTRMIRQCQEKIYASKASIQKFEARTRSFGKPNTEAIEYFKLKIRKEKAKLLLLGVSIDDNS